ncbi:MAG: serpin family protein [Clostridia bacterium]|nr:serpin family protein [Clostridia bacterium]
MKKAKLSGILSLLLAVSVTGCAAPAEDLMKNITPNPVYARELESVSDAAVTDFSVRLFQHSLTDGENTLISPLSVLAALSMTANGAKGETLAQMEAVMGMPVEELNTWLHIYMANLPETEKYKLNIANSIWFTDKESFTVNEDFLQTNADYYHAGIYKAPFDDTTKDAINDWVEENTDGMIRNILDEIPEDAVMYLVNALAFDAEWQETYSTYRIQEGRFTTENGRVCEVEMMYSDEHSYLEDDQATGFLKYYAGGKYAFAALLPEEGGSVPEYAASLTGEHLHTLLTSASAETVETAIPKFETEYDVEMREILEEMGMPVAFGDAADFTGLGVSEDGPVCIGRVLHKTMICVNEKGTKAGASTVVEMVAETCMEGPEQEPKRVYLDRPFVYMLIDCETMVPLFMGTMMDPVG